MGMTIDQELAEISDLALKIKANYLARLKAEKIAMLEELDFRLSNYQDTDLIRQDIQEKINELKVGSEDNNA